MNAELLKKLQQKPQPKKKEESRVAVSIASQGQGLDFVNGSVNNTKDDLYEAQYGKKRQINNVKVIDLRNRKRNESIIDSDSNPDAVDGDIERSGYDSQVKRVDINRASIYDQLKRKFSNRFVNVQNLQTDSDALKTNTIMERYKRSVTRKQKQSGILDESGQVVGGPSSSNTNKVRRKISMNRQRQIGKIIHIVNVKSLNQTIKITISEETRRITKPKKTIIKGTMEEIVNTSIPDPKNAENLIRADSYYLNNRKAFINFMNTSLLPYRDISKSNNISCKDLDKAKKDEFNLLPHQNIVREYMSVYTPYRGLLLYHGLGSGKTCSSIAIAEGLKSSRRVIVMTPASLRMNYMEELKHCGDALFKKTQHWNFVSILNNEPMALEASKRLGIRKAYIEKRSGVWVMDKTQSPNYASLSVKEKRLLDDQLNEMIRFKYRFIHYNGGIRYNTLDEMENQAMRTHGTRNPFDNHVVIIDEVHNFISRIVNKIGRRLTNRNQTALSIRLYKHLMNAQNCKLVFLSGTPMINYPNEIGVLFNMLRGYIITWKISVKQMSTRDGGKIDTGYFRKILADITSTDHIHYTPSTGILEITKNPFGFVNDEMDSLKKKNDVSGNVTNAQFQDLIIQALRTNGFTIDEKGIQKIYNKSLPDEKDEFNKLFVNTNPPPPPPPATDSTTTTTPAYNPIVNSLLLKRRIIGLTSYFRSAQEKLMPRFLPSADIKVFKIPMSNEQFAVYNKARSAEREQERNMRKTKRRNQGNENADGGAEPTSTYRIFSRLFCNYVFPPEIPRPLPQDGVTLEAYIKKTNGKIDEGDIDNVNVEEKALHIDNDHEVEDLPALEEVHKEVVDTEYEKRIEYAIGLLEKDKDKFFSKTALQRYSPKFLQILENLQNEEYGGLHLIYSQFRTLEGIGILKMVMEANGFAEFKLKNDKDGWKMDFDMEKDGGKPRFVLYTGTETTEEKEIIRNVFNGNMNFVPVTLREQLKAFGDDNIHGDFIRIFMITSSGAEGISLKNVNYVHIVEPYWHPVRMNQVIGRARRICSHEDLTEPNRFVKVFMYLMKVTEEQIKSEDATEMIANDLSKRNPKFVFTTDETLYEISDMKNDVSNTIMKYVKETSIDCTINATLNMNSDNAEKLECFRFGTANANELSYRPSYKEEENDEVAVQNQETQLWKGKEVKLSTRDKLKREFVVRLRRENEPMISPLYGKLTNEVYDKESYESAKNDPSISPIRIGTLELREVEKDGKMVVRANLIEM